MDSIETRDETRDAKARGERRETRDEMGETRGERREARGERRETRWERRGHVMSCRVVSCHVMTRHVMSCSREARGERDDLMY